MDLIVIADMIEDEEMLRKSLMSINKHQFRKKFLLFDGPRDTLFKKDYDKYSKYKKGIAKEYKDFEIIEHTDQLYYKPLLDNFIRNNYDDLSEDLLILQDDVIVDDCNLEEVLEQKKAVEDCKILYFREDRLRCEHWFNVIDNSLEDLQKTHGWSERVWIINKKDIKEIFDQLVGGCDTKILVGTHKGKFIDVYYCDLMKKGWRNLSDEVKEEHWRKWGTYEHKNIHHKHLAGKRPKR